tara:strand:- start:14 stop:469 length:456 start_codon:yes stop_codon:yes gene_type:complete
MSGIMNALSNEFYKMGTFSDDYYKNIISPYKEGLRQKPGFRQSMKNWQPWRAFMPQSMGGTFYTKPTPMASTALKGAGRLLGPASWFISSPANAGEDEAMARINEQWSQQQNQTGRGDQATFERPSANRGFTQTDYGKAYRRGGIASLWHR